MASFLARSYPAQRALVLEAIFNIPNLRYLAQDETRLGRKTETKRVLTAQGVKPVAKVDWPRDALWLYGVVEPLAGWQFTQEYSKLKARELPAVSQCPI